MWYGIFNCLAFGSLFVAYVLLLRGVFSPKNWIYLGLNVIGGISFVIVGLGAKAWSVWVFNGIWTFVTLDAIISKLLNRDFIICKKEK